MVYSAKTGSSSCASYVSSIIETEVVTPVAAVALFSVALVVIILLLLLLSLIQLTVVPGDFFFILGERMRNNESRIEVEVVGEEGDDDDDETITFEVAESLRLGNVAISSSLLSAIIPL